MTCLNCGKDTTNLLICQECIEAGERLSKSLQAGVQIEYTDGSKQTLKVDPPPLSDAEAHEVMADLVERFMRQAK